MGSTSRRDDGYSRSLSPSGNTLPSSSRPSDHPQTVQGRPSRSGKPKSQSQNNQLTDVPPRQALVAPQIEGKLSYSDYMRQRLSSEHPDAASGSSSGAASSRMREARPAENRTTAVPIAPSNSYQATARRNDTVRHDVEPETWSRGGQRPVDGDRRGGVTQPSSSANSSGRPAPRDAPSHFQATAVQPPAQHSHYENRGGPSNERHSSVPGLPGPDAMTRKDMSSPEHYHSTGSSSQFHVQPFTGFLVTPNPGHLPIQPIAGQPTNLPANFQQGDGLGHFQQPPPYEPRVHPPTHEGAPSGSRTRISRETHNELTPPHVLMPSPPERSYGGGPSTGGWSGSYQPEPNPTLSPGAPIGLHRTASTADRSHQQPNQTFHTSNDTFRPQPSIAYHPPPSSDFTTRNDWHAPRARESREAFDRPPGPPVGLNPPPPVLLSSATADNMRGYSNSHLSVPGYAADIQSGEPTSTPHDQHSYPPSTSQSRRIVNRQPSPHRNPDPNSARAGVQPRRKGGWAGLCGCNRQ